MVNVGSFYSRMCFINIILAGRVEVLQRLAHVTPVELGGKAHPSQDSDNKLDQWLMYAMFLCSCPPAPRESPASGKAKDLYHLIFPSIKSGSEAHVVSTFSIQNFYLHFLSFFSSFLLCVSPMVCKLLILNL